MIFPRMHVSNLRSEALLFLSSSACRLQSFASQRFVSFLSRFSLPSSVVIDLPSFGSTLLTCYDFALTPCARKMTRRHGASTLLLRLLFVFSSTIFSSIADRAHFRNYSEYISGGPAPIQRYKSSNVDSPVFNIQYWNEDAIDLESPYLFFSVGDGASAGPYIFSSKDLSLVYADRTWVASTNVSSFFVLMVVWRLKLLCWFRLLLSII